MDSNVNNQQNEIGSDKTKHKPYDTTYYRDADSNYASNDTNRHILCFI